MKNRMILTTEGVKRMQDITPGYYVYSYDTGKPLLICEIEALNIDTYVSIYTPDGRNQMMAYDEFSVLAGHERIPFREIKFDESRPRIARQPDPYTAGFIFYGANLEEERISVPTKTLIDMSVPIRKYHIAAGETKGDRTYLKWDVDGRDFTWHNFFVGHKFDPSSVYEIIPFAYQYGAHHERMQFIQGVFDAGHIDGFEPYGVAISHKSNIFIHAIQRILWSLNIPCEVQYNLALGYVLKADTSKEVAANFYYNEDYIRNCLRRKDKVVQPNSVLYEQARLCDIKPQTVIIPKLEEPGTLYVDVDYLPIASC